MALKFVMCIIVYFLYSKLVETWGEGEGEAQVLRSIYEEERDLQILKRDPYDQNWEENTRKKRENSILKKVMLQLIWNILKREGLQLI